MPTERVTGDLPLADRERGLLEVLLDSLAVAAERRLPPELVLVGIGIEVGRPDEFDERHKLPLRDRVAAAPGSEFH